MLVAVSPVGLDGGFLSGRGPFAAAPPTPRISEAISAERPDAMAMDHREGMLTPSLHSRRGRVAQLVSNTRDIGSFTESAIPLARESAVRPPRFAAFGVCRRLAATAPRCADWVVLKFARALPITDP
jgi:hypothetical protein